MHAEVAEEFTRAVEDAPPGAVEGEGRLRPESALRGETCRGIEFERVRVVLERQLPRAPQVTWLNVPEASVTAKTS